MSLVAPAIAVLRVNVSATNDPHPVFLRLLTGKSLDDEGTKSLSNDLCKPGAVVRTVLRSDYVNGLRGEPAKEVLVNVSQPEGEPRTVTVLTVCLVDDGVALESDATMLRDFIAGLAVVPWSPEVLVACVSGRNEALATLATCLEAHFSGALITYVDLCPGGQEPTSFWWWRHDNYRVAILPSSGDKPSDKLDKILTTVRAAGIKMAGDPPMLLAPEALLADDQELSQISLLILDLQDNWAFAGGPPPSERQKVKRRKERAAFIGLMETAIGTLQCEVRLILPRNRTLKQLHPDFLESIGASLEIIPDTISVPLGQQLRNMNAEMRRGLMVLDHARDVSSTSVDALEAEHSVLIGLRNAVDHRISLQEARGGGDLATRLDTLFEASSHELQRIIDHGIDVIDREVRAGAYPGIDGKDTGFGSRAGDRWYKHCRLWLHVWARWTHVGSPGDGRANWVIATPEPSDGFSKLFNPRRTLESHPRIQALIAKAISNKCIDGVARLTLACDLFLETVVRGESRAMLRELQLGDVKDDLRVPVNTDPLPSGSHHATGLAGLRASEVVSAERVRAGVITWPRVEKVPNHLNMKQNLKSLGLLMRQAGKLFAALVFIAALAPDFAKSLGGAVNLDPLNKFLSDVIWWMSFKMLPDPGSTGYPIPIGPEGRPLTLVVVAIIGLIVTVWLSVNAHMAQIAEKLDKLRDDTHRVLEDAAGKQLAVARKVISDIVTDDLAAIRNDLQAAIQSRDGRTLRSLGTKLQAIEQNITNREADIEQMRAKKEQRDAEVKARRSQAATILKKFFNLKGLAE